MLAWESGDLGLNLGSVSTSLQDPSLPGLSPQGYGVGVLDQRRAFAFQFCHWDPTRRGPHPRTLRVSKIQAIGTRPGRVPSLTVVPLWPFPNGGVW